MSVGKQCFYGQTYLSEGNREKQVTIEYYITFVKNGIVWPCFENFLICNFTYQRYLGNQNQERSYRIITGSAELIPHEVTATEKRGKNDQEKKKSCIVMVQGPKLESQLIYTSNTFQAKTLSLSSKWSLNHHLHQNPKEKGH